jgi:hypothetical protein
MQHRRKLLKKAYLINDYNYELFLILNSKSVNRQSTSSNKKTMYGAGNKF